MPYVQELDDVRPQLRRGYASNVVTLWPKVAGAAVEVTSPAASWATPTGAPLGTLAVSAALVEGVSRLRVTLDASTLDLDEDYRIDWVFTFDGATHTRTTRCDVVTQPFSAADELALVDLQDVWPDVAVMLRRQAVAQQAGRTAEQQAAVLLVRAWALVRARIKRLIETDYPGSSMPSLIVSREELRPVMVAQAIALAWLADNNPTRAREWEQRVAAAWSELPRLRFDVDQDLVPDVETGAASVVTIGRAW